MTDYEQRKTQAELRQYLDPARDNACVVTAISPAMLEKVLSGDEVYLTRHGVPQGLHHYDDEYMEHVVVLVADNKDPQAIVGAAVLLGWDAVIGTAPDAVSWKLEDARWLSAPIPIEICGVSKVSAGKWTHVAPARVPVLRESLWEFLQ